MKHWLFALPVAIIIGATLIWVNGPPARAQSVAAISAPVLKWQRGGCFSSWCQTGWYSSPAVADIDRDGQVEVIWGSYDVVSLNGATGALE